MKQGSFSLELLVQDTEVRRISVIVNAQPGEVRELAQPNAMRSQTAIRKYCITSL